MRDTSTSGKRKPTKEMTQQEWTDLITNFIDGFDPEGSDDESKFDLRLLYEVTGICGSDFDPNDSFEDDNTRVQGPQQVSPFPNPITPSQARLTSFMSVNSSFVA